MMHRNRIGILLIVLCIAQPVAAARKKSAPTPPAAPRQELTRFCDDLGAMVVRSAERQAQGWSWDNIKQELTPYLTGITEGLRNQYLMTAYVGFRLGSKRAHDLLRKVTVEDCLVPENAAYAHELAQRMAQRAANPSEDYAVWLQLCAVAGDMAGLYVELRDMGQALTKTLQNKTPGTPPWAERMFRDFAMEVYEKRYWSATIARQEIETRCMAKAPR